MSDDRLVTQGGAGLDIALVETDDDMVLDPVRGFVPKTVGDLKRLAILMSKTEFVPACFQRKPSDVFLALNYAIAAGMDNLILGIQDMYVIHGRVSMYGDSCRALLMKSGLAEDIKEEWFGEFPGDDFGCRITMKRKGMESLFIGTFTVEDCKKAGKWGKDTYLAYPKDMIYWRAWHRACGRGFSDVMKGIIPREIVDDFIDIVPSAAAGVATPVTDLDKAAAELGKRKRRGRKPKVEAPAEETPDPTEEAPDPTGSTNAPPSEPTKPDESSNGDAPEGEIPEGFEPDEETLDPVNHHLPQCGCTKCRAQRGDDDGTPAQEGQAEEAPAPQKGNLF